MFPFRLVKNLLLNFTEHHALIVCGGRMFSQGGASFETAWQTIPHHAQGTKGWTNEAKMGCAGEQAVKSRVSEQNEHMLRLLRPLS